MAAVQLFFGAIDGVNVKCRAHSWGVDDSLYPVQTFPKHFLHYPSTLYGNYSVYQSFLVCHLSKLSLKWRLLFKSCQVSTLLTVEAGNLGLIVKKSSILHNSAGGGVFAFRRIGRGAEIRNYYGIFFYGFVKSRLSRGGVCEYGIMAVDANRCMEFTMKVPDKFIMDWGKSSRF